ncbi:hypothetical protein DID75_04140 [Candidatus Marinamargulisbacteria bacterium SCGC AG-410-N11]|nr:hypothetical protein DID75_04140 [Candidatus Marinamargulisbacteria bacterium SCGC AG-410-N11]
MEKKKILIIDDDPSINTIFEFILNQAGHKSISVNSGKEAIDLIKVSNEIILCFLDIDLKNESGLDVFNSISNLNNTIPTILMCGNTPSSLLKKAFKVGAYGIIYKPFDVEEILDIISDIISNLNTNKG